MKKNFIVPNPEQLEYIIGIDFGHGETSAAICRIDNDKDPEDIVLAEGGGKTIPSLMNIASDGNIYIGGDAVFSRSDSDKFYAYFKESPDTLDEQLKPSIHIMKLYMKQVYDTICIRRAGELMEGNQIKTNHVVFIACPSKSQKWDDKAMQNYVQMALDAGLPIAGATIDDKFQLSGIVRESRAAYIRMLQKKEVEQVAKEGILVVDYGSSTIDITYYKEDENPVDKGYELGAQNVEKKIFNHLKTWHEELGNEQLPTIIETLEDRDIKEYTKLLFDIRESKEQFYSKYSRTKKMEISYEFPPTYTPNELSVRIMKNNVDTIIDEYINQVKQAFLDFKDNIIGNKPITLLVLTGGASKMNFVITLAQSVFGTQAKLLPPQDSSLTVSNGIATAGRADIQLYYMATELLSKKMPDSLYQDVRDETIESITNIVIGKVSSVYSRFKNGLSYPYKNNITELEYLIKSEINQLGSSYKIKLDEAFRCKIDKYINGVEKGVRFEINTYISTHFPHYKISAPTEYHVPQNISILFTPENLNTLNTAIGDSVDEITNTLGEIIIKIAWNLIKATFVAALGIVANAGIFINNLISDKKEEYLNISNGIDNVTNDNCNDKNTILNEKQREKIYNTFIKKKGEYKSLLKQDISNRMPNFKSECNTTAEEIISRYIIDEINRIQLQIK